ncbi:MAG: signal peptidase I [Bacilli bacterium]|jgi:signal peptidase I|nr:signal peptidase I [Bacilli bacterium]
MKKQFRKILTILILLYVLLGFLLLNITAVPILNAETIIGLSILAMAVFLTYQNTHQLFSFLKEKNQPLKTLYQLLDYFEVIISALFFVQIVFFFIFFPVVNQTSMNPTFFEGDRLVVVTNPNELNREDIVVFQVDQSIQIGISTSEDKELWIKRVIGLPGEHIEFFNGNLYINGVQYTESYLLNEYNQFYFGSHIDDQGMIHHYHCLTANFTINTLLTSMGLNGSTIPEGYYLLLGDNRVYSRDSREIGLVHASQIVGKVTHQFISLWDWEKVGE